MIRRSFAKGALGLLGALALGWIPHAAAVQGNASCQYGVASGMWDLPEPSSAGVVQGQLFDASGQVAYYFVGKLIETPSPCLSCREGDLIGTLDDGFGPCCDYEVRGTWIVNQFTGKGSFKAKILLPAGPALVPKGRMAGLVNDPPSSPNQPGSFKARWGICP